MAGVEEAIARCRDDGARIDLLLTDVLMPTMSGPRLATLLREVAPSLRVLYMSGYPADALSRQGLETGEEPLVEKPFSPNELLRQVRAVLDRP